MIRTRGRPGRIQTPCLLLLAIMAATIIVPALDAGPQVQRYLSLTGTPSPLVLGAVSQPGIFDSAAVLAAHLATNCAHKGVIISTSGLQSAGGQSIPPDRILVRMPDTGFYAPMTNPLMVSPAAGPAVCDFQLQFRVEALPTDQPGTYSGTFQLFILCAPEWPDVPGSVIQVSLEVETYGGYELQGGKGYVHLGRWFDATDEVLTLRPTGSFTANAAMYVGLNLSNIGGPGQEPVERDGQGRPTGRILGAMIGTKDVLGRSITNEAFDVMVRLSWDGGTTCNPPNYFGASPDGFISKTLWWLIGDGVPGRYNWVWDVRLIPGAAQADGNYFFSAEIMMAPRL